MFWPIAAIIVGFTVAVLASRVAVDAASAIVRRTRVPPFVIGITLVAIGTDLPEIVNSFVASAQGHGDVNVGDSIGSAVTQATLVLGLVPLIGGAIVITRRRITTVGACTIVALSLGAVLLSDGDLSRLDGILLVGTWLVTSLIIWRQGHLQTHDVPPESTRRHSFLEFVGGFSLIIGGVMAAVWGIVDLAEQLGTPAYLISFFGAALGTSLPELVFVAAALRRGQKDLAVGDIFGSSLLDSTLSIGIGPTFFPVAVSADLAFRGSMLAAAAIGLVVMVLVGRRRHDWKSGIGLIAIYAAFYPLLLA